MTKPKKHLVILMLQRCSNIAAAGAFSTATAGLALVVANPMFKKLWHESASLLQAVAFFTSARKQTAGLICPPELRQMNPEDHGDQFSCQGASVSHDNEAQARCAMILHFAKSGEVSGAQSARLILQTISKSSGCLKLHCRASRSLVSPIRS